MNEELYSKELLLNGKTYKFHQSVKDETLQAVTKWQNTTIGETAVFKTLFGRLTPERKEIRKVIKAIIRAKHNPINNTKEVICVKLSDRTIKLKPLRFQ